MISLLSHQRATESSPRLLTVLLTFAAILFGCNTVFAETFESGGIYFKTIADDEVEVTEHPNPVWGYAGGVTIPATVSHTGKTYRVTAIGERAFEEDHQISNIHLMGNVTVIKKAAFRNSSISTIDFGRSPLVSIEEEAFAYCERLDIVNLEPTLKRIGFRAFCDCFLLDNFGPLSDDLDLEFVGDEAFFHTGYISGTKEVYLGKCLLKCEYGASGTYSIKEGTTYIGPWAFQLQGGLTTVNIPASVKYIGHNAFAFIDNLTTVNFADESRVEYVYDNAFLETSWFNNKPAGPVYIGKTFYKFKDWYWADEPEVYNVKDGTKYISAGCFAHTGFKTITLPNSVVEIGPEAFSFCSILESVVLPTGLKRLNPGVFEFCSNIPEIDIPSSVETIDKAAFEGCEGLKSIHLSSHVNYIAEGAFMNCSASFEVDPDNTRYCVVDGVLFTNDKKTLLAVPTPREGDYVVPDYVERIGSGAFSGSQLKSITVPAQLTSIQDDTFYGCPLLENVTFKTPSRIKSIGTSAIYDCKNLKSLVLPDSLEYLAEFGVFSCPLLENITFPETLKGADGFGNNAFYNTAWLDKQPDGVVYAGKLAVKVKGEVPEVIEIKEGTRYVNPKFLEYDKTVKKVVFPASLQRIGNRAFAGCSQLTEITGGTDALAGTEIFRDTPWYKAQEEKDSVIYYGKNAIGFVPLSYLEVKEGTEYLNFGSIESISQGIVKLQLPKSLKHIAAGGLEGMMDCRTFISLNPEPPVFEGHPLFELGNSRLNVLESSVPAYNNAPGWCYCFDIIGVPQLSIHDAKAGSTVRLSAHHGHIRIADAAAGTPVQVYDAQGRIVYHGTDTLIRVPAAGLYIVRVADQSHKIVVTD